MAVTCPHCKGEIGFSAALSGKRVACPYCTGAFAMPTNDSTPDESIGRLVERLLQAQAASSRSIDSVSKQLHRTHSLLRDVAALLVILLIITVIILCGGITVTVTQPSG